MNFLVKLSLVKKGGLMLLLLLATGAGCKKGKYVTVKSIYNGQIWTELSDSFGELNIIQPALEQRLGVSIITNAVSGSCIANGFDDAQVDGIHRLSFIERLPGAIKDPSRYILLVTGGNDWNYNVPLGNPADTIKTSYYGALNYIAIQTVKSNKKGIWVTMIQRNTVKYGGNVLGSINYSDQKQYADAMIEVGEKHGIKVINAFANSGITYSNSSTYTSDGAHPVTAAGKALYSNFIVAEILNKIGIA